MPVETRETEPVQLETPAAKPPAGWLRRLMGMRFLFISIIVHLVLGLIAAVWVVQQYAATRKLTFKAGAPSPNRASRAIEHKVQMAKKQNMMSAPAVKRIVSTGAAKFTLPEMPAMPRAAVKPNQMAGATGMNLGALGGPAGAAASSAGGGPVSMFGLREASSGGIKGTFYDLKQTAGRKPTEMDPDKYGALVYEFIQEGWNATVLNKFYRAPSPLYATRFLIPAIPAEEGPKAFDVGRDVQPRMWLAWYKGDVIAPESGTFSFVGAGDDVLFVRFRGKTVLGACWNINSEKITKSLGNYHYKWREPEQPGGFVKGERVQVEAGKSYPIEILVGEQPGGQFSAIFLIEKEGATYPKEPGGNPILPVFRMGPAKPFPLGAGQKLPPHSEEGPIWRAESSSRPGMFSTIGQ